MKRILFCRGTGEVCSVLLFILCATSAWATVYTIDGTTGNTLADIAPRIVNGDVVKVACDQTTGTAYINLGNGESFTLESATPGKIMTITQALDLMESLNTP